MSPGGSRRLFIGIALASPVAVTCALALLNHFGQASVGQSSDLVRGGLELQANIIRVMTGARAAEAGQRTYLITGSGRSLAATEDARREALHSMSELRRLATSNNRQQIDQLDELLRARLRALELPLLLRTQGLRDSAFAVVAAGRGTALMDLLLDASETLMTTGTQALAVQRVTLESRAARLRLLTWSLLAGNLLILAAVGLVIRAVDRQRALVTICAWSRVIQYEGEWLTFEQYLGRRFDLDVTHGMSPAVAAQLMEATAEREASAPAAAPRRRPFPPGPPAC